MEGIVAKITEWIIKKILSVIFQKQRKRKEKTIIELNRKDGVFRYERMIEYEHATESKNNLEQYGRDEADKSWQTNKGDNNNAKLDASRNEN